MSRDEVIAAMAQALDAAQFHPYAQAEAALDAALPMFGDMVCRHGLAETLHILAGRDPRLEVAAAAIRALGADEAELRR